MPTVQVEGLGNVQFPDGMAEEEMTRHIQQALAEKNEAPPAVHASVPVPEALQGKPDIEEGNREALQRGFPGIAKGALGTIGDTGALVNKIPYVGEKLAPKSEVDYFQQHAKANNPDEQAGKLVEGGLEMALPMLKGVEALPSAARAGSVLGDVAEAAKNAHVPLSKTIAPLQRVTELGERGGTLPTSANALLKRTQMLGDMTFPEARDYYSNISSLSADEANKLSPIMKKAVGAMKSGFHGDLKTAADTVGMGEEYANAMKEYANAMRLRHLGKTALTKVLPAGGALGAIGYGINKLREHF